MNIKIKTIWEEIIAKKKEIDIYYNYRNYRFSSDELRKQVILAQDK